MAEVGKIGKVYGLIKPKENKASSVINKPSIFDEQSDDENSEKGSIGPIGAALLQKKKYETKVKMQTQLEIDKALAEDPTCYEYDSVYDGMQREKTLSDVKVATKADRKPKYIGGLLKAAEKRKREYERQVERGVQKERENEGDEFADKESFVTSAYKQKMEEIQKEEERAKREEELETMLDVTKQKDMSGFYRYLYKETTAVPVPSLSDARTDDNQSESGANRRFNRSDRPVRSRSRESQSSTEEDESTPRKRLPSKEGSGSPEYRSMKKSRHRSKSLEYQLYKRKNRQTSRSPDYESRRKKTGRESQSPDYTNKKNTRQRSKSPSAKGQAAQKLRSPERQSSKHNFRQRSWSPGYKTRKEKTRQSRSPKHKSRKGKDRQQSRSPELKSRIDKDRQSRSPEHKSRKEKDRQSRSPKHKSRIDKDRQSRSPEHKSRKEKARQSRSPKHKSRKEKDRQSRSPEYKSTKQKVRQSRSPICKGKGYEERSQSNSASEEESSSNSRTNRGNVEEKDIDAKYDRKTSTSAVDEARARYLARKLVRRNVALDD